MSELEQRILSETLDHYELPHDDPDAALVARKSLYFAQRMLGEHVKELGEHLRREIERIINRCPWATRKD
jgi:hypothetical protein